MKLEIPKTFPNQMTNEEIQEVISKCAKRSSRATQPDVNVTLGANYYVSMIELGLSELNKRVQSDLLDLIDKQNKENKKATSINWILSGLTIFLAILTIYIGHKSLNFAELDEKSDSSWQSQQIDLLEKQNIELKKMNEFLIFNSKQDSIKKLHTTTAHRK